MQDANLSQVSLRFRNVVPYGTQLVPDCNLAGMIQRSFKALDVKRSTSGKGEIKRQKRRTNDLKSNIQVSCNGPDGRLLLRGRGVKKSNKIFGVGSCC